MGEIRYRASFPLKYGDVCERCYKTLAIARREISKAYNRFQAPERFYATIYSYEVGVRGSAKLIEEIWL